MFFLIKFHLFNVLRNFDLQNLFCKQLLSFFKLVLNFSFVFHYLCTYIKVYIRSSDASRCLQSAETQLAGLYPPIGYQVCFTFIFHFSL